MDEAVLSSDHFRMYEFKVRKCNRRRGHDWRECPFAHRGEKARRRDPRRFGYSGTACSEFGKGRCRKGDNCEFSHGVFECWLHPSRYRTEACKDGNNCKRKVCFFAHSTRQLRILPDNKCCPNLMETIELPQEMIQHIQSYLNGKEAAQTTILSKSWYNAWLTRTNLDFDDRDKHIPKSESAFVYFVETLQRYERLNLKIQNFKLSLWRDYYIIGDEISQGTVLIKKAMKLGATDLDINISDNLFGLPREVLRSESLVRLSMQCGVIKDLQDLTCWRLKYLNLDDVSIDDHDNNIWYVICRMCPLIEELILSDLCIYCSQPGFIANDFRKLKVLSLQGMEIGEWLFPYLSSKFPCLKELKLMFCTGYNEVQICSDSLESVILLEDFYSMTSRVEFDVPRIRRFECELNRFVNSFSFKTTSREWESHITVYFSCFVKLRKFLLELSSSKIYLCLKIYYCHDDAYEYASHMIGLPHDDAYEYASHMIGLPKPPIVERLELCLDAPSSANSALLEGLFWSCRPNFIWLRLSFNEDKYDVVKCICETLTKEERAVHDLEEVNVEISKDIAWTWSRNMRASKFAYSGLIGNDNVCLHLKWG